MKIKRVSWQVALAYALAVMVLIWILTPFIVALVSSFKVSTDFQREFTFLPKTWRWENYKDALEFVDLMGFMINSIICAVAVTLLGTMVCSMSAFGFSRVQFRGRDKLFQIFILTQGVPFSVLAIPLYMMITKMGMVNTKFGLIIPLILYPMGVFILRQAMLVIPRDYEESAMLDGCGRWKMFTKIFLPMTRNSVIAVAIFMFMQSWNNYVWPLIIISDKAQYTLPIGLTLYTAQASMSRRPEWSVILAACLISAAPMILFYILFSKRFMAGVSAGGVKG